MRKFAKVIISLAAVIASTGAFAASKSATETWVKNYVSTNSYRGVTEVHSNGVTYCSYKLPDGKVFHFKYEDSSVQALRIAEETPQSVQDGYTNTMLFAWNGIGYKNGIRMIGISNETFVVNGRLAQSTTNGVWSAMNTNGTLYCSMKQTMLQPSVANGFITNSVSFVRRGFIGSLASFASSAMNLLIPTCRADEYYPFPKVDTIKEIMDDVVKTKMYDYQDPEDGDWKKGTIEQLSELDKYFKNKYGDDNVQEFSKYVDGLIDKLSVTMSDLIENINKKILSFDKSITKWSGTDSSGSSAGRGSLSWRNGSLTLTGFAKKEEKIDNKSIVRVTNEGLQIKGFGNPGGLPYGATIADILKGDKTMGDGDYVMVDKGGESMAYMKVGRFSIPSGNFVADDKSLATNSFGYGVIKNFDEAEDKTFAVKFGDEIHFVDPGDDETIVLDDSAGSLCLTLKGFNDADGGALARKSGGAFEWAATEDGDMYYGTGHNGGGLGWHMLPNVTTNAMEADDRTLREWPREDDPTKKLIGIYSEPGSDGPYAAMMVDDHLAWVCLPTNGLAGNVSVDGCSITNTVYEGETTNTVMELYGFANAYEYTVGTKNGGVLEWHPMSDFCDGDFLQTNEWNALICPRGWYADGGPTACQDSLASELASSTKNHYLLSYYTAGNDKHFHYLPVGNMVGFNPDNRSLVTNVNGIASIYGYSQNLADDSIPHKSASGIAWYKYNYKNGVKMTESGSTRDVEADLQAGTGITLENNGNAIKIGITQDDDGYGSITYVTDIQWDAAAHQLKMTKETVRAKILTDSKVQTTTTIFTATSHDDEHQ